MIAQVRTQHRGLADVSRWPLSDLRRASKSCHSFGALLLKKPRCPCLLTVVWPVWRHFTESVFAGGRVAVEAEQRGYDRQGGDWNQEVFPALLDLRALLLNRGRPVTERAAGQASLSPRPADAVGPAGPV